MMAAAQCEWEDVGDGGARRSRSGGRGRAGGSWRRRRRPVAETGKWGLEDIVTAAAEGNIEDARDSDGTWWLRRGDGGRKM